MHTVLYWDESRYSCFPTVVKGERDRLWVGFNWNTMRTHMGGLDGGQSGRVELYSPDGGETWYEDGKHDAYLACPEELRSAVLRDGTQIRISRPPESFSGEARDDFVSRGFTVQDLPNGRIHVEHRLLMSRKRTGSDTWEERYLTSGQELPQFSIIRNGFEFGGGVLPDDTILNQAYGCLSVGEPFRAWVLRSEDAGDTWDMVTMACDGGVNPFNESSLLQLPGGRILAMVRNASASKRIPLEDKYLWQTHSDDGGKTWAPPRRTDIWGYPAHLLMLSTGDVLCSYGHRREPYGVRACFSRDGGETWDVDNAVILRRDGLLGGDRGAASDLGYPRTVELSDGSLYTVYYFTLGDGVTHIAATKWRP